MLLAFWGCANPVNEATRVVIWHQMRPDERELLVGQLQRYMQQHEGVTIVELYKETEEVRNAFVISAIAGQGPDLIYGPSDPVGVYEATKTIRPLEDLFPASYLSQFDSSGLLFYKGHLYQIADKIGNHLALVYNKKYVQTPPQTDQELIEMSQALQDRFGSLSGRPNVYGLTWNYTEPFFFIPFFTGWGGWVFAADGVTPTLDTEPMTNALQFVRELRDKYKIVPGEADYEIADALFKDGKAAMIINGDWSWAGYAERGLDIGVAPLPKIVETGLWCAPMTSPKGYSINMNVPEEKLPLVLDLLHFLLSVDSQRETVQKLHTAPTLKVLYQDTLITGNDILKNSLIQIHRGRPMPVVPEMRAIWDAMRPAYQAVMGGARTPAQASHDMEQLALRKIKEMSE